MTTADHAHPVASSDTEETGYVPQSAPPPPSALIKLSSAGDVYRSGLPACPIEPGPVFVCVAP
jgi:hypothetical protein